MVLETPPLSEDHVWTGTRPTDLCSASDQLITTQLICMWSGVHMLPGAGARSVDVWILSREAGVWASCERAGVGQVKCVREDFECNGLISSVITQDSLFPCPGATHSDVQPENYYIEGLLSRELTFTPMPKENVLRTLYTLRLYPALKSSERVRL